MTKQNPYDVARKAMAAEYTKAREALANELKGFPPYGSVKLSPEDERMLYDHPERILPGGVGDQAQARIALKKQMGAAKYAKWLREMNGVE